MKYAIALSFLIIPWITHQK